MLLEVRLAVISGAVVLGRGHEMISGVLVMFPDLGTGYMGVFIKPDANDLCAFLYSYFASIKTKSLPLSSSSSNGE